MKSTAKTAFLNDLFRTKPGSKWAKKEQQRRLQLLFKRIRTTTSL